MGEAIDTGLRKKAFRRGRRRCPKAPTKGRPDVGAEGRIESTGAHSRDKE